MACRFRRDCGRSAAFVGRLKAAVSSFDPVLDVVAGARRGRRAGAVDGCQRREVAQLEICWMIQVSGVDGMCVRRGWGGGKAGLLHARPACWGMNDPSEVFSAGRAVVGRERLCRYRASISALGINRPTAAMQLQSVNSPPMVVRRLHRLAHKSGAFDDGERMSRSRARRLADYATTSLGGQPLRRLRLFARLGRRQNLQNTRSSDYHRKRKQSVSAIERH